MSRRLAGYVVLGACSSDPWGLGALTAQQAAQQVFPNAPRSASAGHNMATFNVIQAAVSAGQLVDTNGQPAYVPGTGDCSASGVSGGAQDLQLAGKAGSLALQGVSVGAAISGGLPAAAALAPITGGISIAIAGIVGIFSMILNHHAQAVAKEQSSLCAAVPAANNYLKLIAQAVQNGQASPTQAIAALNSLYSDFNSAVASIRHGSDPTVSGECNAACVMSTALHAIVLQQTSAYQDLAARTPMPSASGPVAAAPVTSGSTATIPTGFGPTAPAAVTAPASASALPPASSSTALPSWLPIAALVVGGFFLAKVL